jgi:hypothetical protein
MIYAGKILSFLALNEPIAFAIIDKVMSKFQNAKQYV